MQKGIFIFLLAQSVLFNPIVSGDVGWTQRLELDTGFQIQWDGSDPEFFTVEMSAPTTGYLGMGFSPHGDMRDSDIVIAWVDSDGSPHIKDFHGNGRKEPIIDTVQDYFLTAAAEKDERTTVRFHRRWETCDEDHDMKIGDDTMTLIWAWHTEDPSFNETGWIFPWHGAETRGSLKVYMRLPSLPLPFPDGPNGEEKPPPDITIWDLTMENVDIDASSRNSFLMCRQFKLPPFLDGKYHLIGFRPLITEENEGFIHRIFVHQCRIRKEDTDKLQFFARVENHEAAAAAAECLVNDDKLENTDEEDSSSFGWREYCSEIETIASWGLGSEGEMFPVHVGLASLDVERPSNHQHHYQTVPEESSSSDLYLFKLEVHYVNVTSNQFLDSSGIRLFFTNEMRLHSGAILSIGHRVSPFLTLPPSQENFRIYSVCSSDCTRNGIPDGGIYVFGVMLQSHEAGKKMQLHHIRNGKELPIIAEDGNYTHKYQQHRVLRNEVRILPGDDLVLECGYNTMDRDKFTFGGYSNEEEACQAQLYYYPKANLTLCESKPEFQSFFAAFGIRNVVGNGLMRLDHQPQKEGGDLLPPKFQLEAWPRPDDVSPFDTLFIVSPSTLFNVSLIERMNKINWTRQQVAKNTENSWRNGKHYAYCEGLVPDSFTYGKYVTEIPRFKRHPKVTTSECRRTSHRHSGEDKTHVEIVVLAVALFSKIIFNACYYFDIN